MASSEYTNAPLSKVESAMAMIKGNLPGFFEISAAGVK
jgi:hypothetical protein